MRINFNGPDWSINEVEAVLFDKDGTIIDSHLYWGAIIQKRSLALIKKIGAREDLHHDICLTMGYSLEEKKLLPVGPIALVSRGEVISILQDYFTRNGFAITEDEIGYVFTEVHADFLKEIYSYIEILPGVKDLLIDLKNRGIKMALITSDSIINARAIMNHLGLEKYFDLITGMEFTSSPKISGVPAIEVCKALEVGTENVICIGDAPMDIMMGEQAKLKACISVALGQTPFAELVQKNKYSLNNFYQLTIN